jgi:dihydrodipicolinate synthase/N-acetylneuraminate lyase
VPPVAVVPHPTYDRPRSAPTASWFLPPSVTPANDDGLLAYYRAIAASTKLGIVLFQTPAFDFSVGLLRCLREAPNIVGMNDEHGDMKQFVRQWRAASDRLELQCGVGEILAPSYFVLGVKGFTSGIVNFMPRTPLRIMELLRNSEGPDRLTVRISQGQGAPHSAPWASIS